MPNTPVVSAKIHKIILSLGTTFFLLFSLGSSFFVLAADELTKDTPQNSAQDLQAIQNKWEVFHGQIEDQYSDRIQKNKDRMDALKKEIEQNLLIFGEKSKEVEENEKIVEELKQKLTTLKGQLESMDQQMEVAERKVRAIQEQIAAKESALQKVMEEKEKVVVETEYQKDIILSYFRLLQTESESLSPESENGLRILLSSDSFTKSLRDEKNYSALEVTARRIFHDLEQAMSQLEEIDYLFSEQRTELKNLYAELEDGRKRVAVQQNAQQTLVEETSGEESRFQALLKESKSQMEQSSQRIAETKDDINYIEEKLSLLAAAKKSDQSKISKLQVLDDLESGSVNYDIGKVFLAEDEENKPFAWPLAPEKITAYFHDEKYKDAFGVVHNAIDIRAPQGTSVRAPAAGYVLEVADNGFGYSYLILIHKNNLTTVYGHLSEFDVKEGDLVQAGDIIGKSGGALGTKGAGVMTTGSHLHFEVWKDGEVQDPLLYLPLDALQPEDIPKEFLIKSLLQNEDSTLPKNDVSDNTKSDSSQETEAE
ncbi:peptidoglycan DD-metalloendopeptidase family protein [Candidatus Peregrinibacteria bacterium]|nr:peptidoglycan DD-metalloendopeptidase family protein [Candidatus Peregrinibacteria bacterium]